MSFEPSLRQKVRSQIGVWLQGRTHHGVPELLKPVLQYSPFWQLLYRHPMEALMIFDSHREDSP